MYRPNTSRIFLGYLNIFLFQGKFNMTKKTIFLSQLSIFLSWIANFLWPQLVHFACICRNVFDFNDNNLVIMDNTKDIIFINY